MSGAQVGSRLSSGDFRFYCRGAARPPSLTILLTMRD